jgi:hypothetical protein
MVRIHFPPAESPQTIGSSAAEPIERRQLVWQIERKLIEEDARPDILYVRGITGRDISERSLTCGRNRADRDRPASTAPLRISQNRIPSWPSAPFRPLVNGGFLIKNASFKI